MKTPPTVSLRRREFRGQPMNERQNAARLGLVDAAMGQERKLTDPRLAYDYQRGRECHIPGEGQACDRVDIVRLIALLDLLGVES